MPYRVIVDDYNDAAPKTIVDSSKVVHKEIIGSVLILYFNTTEDIIYHRTINNISDRLTAEPYEYVETIPT